MLDVLLMLGVLVLAAVLGFVTIRQVPPMLHTPLMSMTNAISGVTILGALLLFAVSDGTTNQLIGGIGLAAAAFNMVGGFVITDRMLSFFRSKPPVDEEVQSS